MQVIVQCRIINNLRQTKWSFYESERHTGKIVLNFILKYLTFVRMMFGDVLFGLQVSGDGLVLDSAETWIFDPKI